jgi:hypothetical protein
MPTGELFIELENGNHGTCGQITVSTGCSSAPQSPSFRLFPDIRRVKCKAEIPSDFTLNDPGRFNRLQSSAVKLHRFSSFARYASKNCINASCPMP